MTNTSFRGYAMNRSAVVLLTVVLASDAVAGAVSIPPLGETTVFNDPLVGPTTIDYRLGINDDFGPDIGSQFSGVAINIGVDSGPTLSFDSTVFCGLLSCDPPLPQDPSMVMINDAAFDKGWQSPLPDIGTLTVDGTGAAPGE